MKKKLLGLEKKLLNGGKNNMINKKDKAIVLGTTGNRAFALATVLLGIKKHSPELQTDYIIYYKDLSEKDKKLLNSILPCKFIEYKFTNEEVDLNKSPYFNQFTLLAYSRYECFTLLKEYKNVLWLDIDILVQKNITGIFNANKTGFAAYYYPEDIVKVMDNFTEPIKGYINTRSINSGVMVMNDNLKSYEKLTQWCYDKTVEIVDKLTAPDQGIINLMFQEFDIKVTELDKIYNFQPTHKIKENKGAVLLHSSNIHKYWNFWNFKEWNELYSEWIKMGGSKYTGKRVGILERNWIYRWGSIPYPLKHTKKFMKWCLSQIKQKPVVS